MTRDPLADGGTTWRIIDGETWTEPMHHALDAELLDRLQNGEMPPTLRVWYRGAPAVPLGRFQSYVDEVVTEYVESNGIDVVRRITGGGAMFVQPGKVVTYSMYLPRGEVPDDVEESYEVLNQWAIDALNDMGVGVFHEPLNDIAHPDGKIGGAAQLRQSEAVLHHVTMSYDLDVEEMLRVLRIGKQKVSDKAVKSAEKRVARIADYTDASREAVIERLVEQFEAVYGGEVGELTTEERRGASQRVEAQFGTDEWNKKL